MAKLIVVNSVTLDGVMQAPGRPDEDTRGGFTHGGWAQPYNDPVMAKTMGEGMAQGGPLLFGRRTYEDFAAFWPHQTDNPFTPVLNQARKYVVSTTLREPLPWVNSTLLSDDVVTAVANLKAEPGPDIVMLGSGQLIGSLLPHGLIDAYTLLIHPLVLGSGRRLFPTDGSPLELELTRSVPTTTGVVIATYEPVLRK
jgi:dihydrofolate reductase